MRSLSFASTKLVAGVCAVAALLAIVATAAAWPTNPAAPPAAPTPRHSGLTAPLPRSAPGAGGFLDHRGHVYSVSYAPGGKAFVSVGDRRAVVWDAETRQKLFVVDGAEFAAFSPTGKALLVMGPKTVLEYDAGTGKVREEHPLPKTQVPWIRGAFSPDGKRFAVLAGESPRVFEIATGAEARAFQKDEGALRFVPRTAGAFAFSADGRYIIAANGCIGPEPFAPGVRVWDTKTGNVARAVRGNEWSATAGAIHPDGNLFVVASGNRIKTYPTNPNVKLDPIVYHAGPVTALAYSADGTVLAAALREDTRSPVGNEKGAAIAETAITFAVALFDTATGKQIQRFEGFPDNLPIASLAFSPNGKELLCGSGFAPGDDPVEGAPPPATNAKGLRVLNLNEPAKPAPVKKWKERAVIELAGWQGGSVAYPADGKTLFVGGTEGIVHAYDAATRKKLWEYKSDSSFAAVAAGGSEMLGTRALAVAGKGGVRLLDPVTGKVVDTLDEKGVDPVAIGWFPDRSIRNAAPDGRPTIDRKVIFGTATGYTVKLWPDGPKLRGADTTGTITTTTVSEDKEPADRYAVPLAVVGQRGVVVTGPIDPRTGKNVLWMWSAGAGTANELLDGHKAPVVSAACSQDGTVLATGDADGLVLVWDAATVKVKDRVNLGGRVAALAISSDAKHLAAAVVSQPLEQREKPTYREDVFVWSAAGPRPKPDPVSRTSRNGTFGGFASVAFAPDGKTFSSAFANLERPEKALRNGLVRVFVLE